MTSKKAFTNWKSLTVTPPVVPDRRWSTLKKEGHKRCGAIFTNGKQCCNHVADPDAHNGPMTATKGWLCTKHACVMDRHIQPLKKQGLI